MAAIPVPAKGEATPVGLSPAGAVASQELGTRAWVTDLLVTAKDQLSVS